MPAVIPVDGNVKEMFFNESLHVAACADESSNDGHFVKTFCSWFNPNFESLWVDVGLTKCDLPPIVLVSNHDKLQPAEDQEDALFKSEQVTLKEDFDCSDASLESEGDLNCQALF